MSNFDARLQESVVSPPPPRRPLTARFLRPGPAGAANPRTKEPSSVDGSVPTVVTTVAVAVAVAVLIESQCWPSLGKRHTYTVEVTVSVRVAATVVLILVGALLTMMLIPPMMLMTVFSVIYVLITTVLITTWGAMITATVFGLK